MSTTATNTQDDSPISMLLANEDVLLQVLVRTCASDHPALRQTCKSVCRILDSAKFHRERMLSEWAEVEAVVLDPLELYLDDSDGDQGPTDSFYKEHYNYLGFCSEGVEVPIIWNKFHVKVDGKPAGKGEFSLISRNTRRFLEYCDVRSSDMADTGSLFFDNKGRPVLESIKNAIPSKDTRFFLYLEEMTLDEEYRQHTWIGASAIRMVLTQGLLQNEWSVAIYIPDARSQFTGDDKARHHASDNSGADGEWKARYKLLRELDMRQYMRAGFKQAEDAEAQSKCHYLYTVPSFLDQTSHSMISHDQAMEMTISQPTRTASKEPEGVDAELLGTASFCLLRMREAKQDMESIEGWKEREEVVLLRSFAAEFGIRKIIEEKEFAAKEYASLKNQVEKLQRLRKNSGKRYDELSNKLFQLQDDIGIRVTELELNHTKKLVGDDGPIGDLFKSLVEKAVNDRRRNLEADYAKYDKTMRENVTNFVNEKGASIMNSTVIHYCARFGFPDALRYFLSFVPEQDHSTVVNFKDCDGETPLIKAARAAYHSQDHYFDILETLLCAGADKNLTDKAGRSAYGNYLQAQCFANKIFQLSNSSSSGRSRFEKLLLPKNGPTPKDTDTTNLDETDASMGSENHSEFDSEGDFDEDMEGSDGDDEEW